ncbi:hypothetical protein Bca52824_070376 [Brassica carinata]|uniref:Uncharacterized protein n=1 Tax=Brassica carinata TaxID=52824 RepID=A0A8X7U266_BRACI|nr:hypothetical protein Bca52824_070376 [Brassica carinata]
MEASRFIDAGLVLRGGGYLRSTDAAPASGRKTSSAPSLRFMNDGVKWFTKILAVVLKPILRDVVLGFEVFKVWWVSLFEFEFVGTRGRDFVVGRGVKRVLMNATSAESSPAKKLAPESSNKADGNSS